MKRGVKPAENAPRPAARVYRRLLGFLEGRRGVFALALLAVATQVRSNAPLLGDLVLEGAELLLEGLERGVEGRLLLLRRALAVLRAAAPRPLALALDELLDELALAAGAQRAQRRALVEQHLHEVRPLELPRDVHGVAPVARLRRAVRPFVQQQLHHVRVAPLAGAQQRRRPVAAAAVVQVPAHVDDRLGAGHGAAAQAARRLHSSKSVKRSPKLKSLLKTL